MVQINDQNCKKNLKGIWKSSFYDKLHPSSNDFDVSFVIHSSRKGHLISYLCKSTSLLQPSCLSTILQCLAKAKKTGPWNGHSSVIFPGLKPDGMSKDGTNIICTS